MSCRKRNYFPGALTPATYLLWTGLAYYHACLCFSSGRMAAFSSGEFLGCAMCLLVIFFISSVWLAYCLGHQPSDRNDPFPFFMASPASYVFFTDAN
jgi:hypothetical protein